MSTSKVIAAFIGGALVGAAAALLFAPEKGEDLRARIKDLLARKGIIANDDEIDALVDRLTAEVEQ